MNILYGIFIDLHNIFTKLTRRTAINFKKRMAIYRMLEKMTGEPAALQINDAIIELQAFEINKDLKTRMWYVYEDILEQMRSTDADFSHAFSKYIPQQDVMILQASEQDDITLGFSTLIESNKKTKLMKNAFSSALAYPVFLLLALCGVIYYFSVKIIPAMVAAVPSGVELSGNSKLLILLSQSFPFWFPFFVLAIIFLIGFVIWALPNMIAKWRKYLEEIPPFNMYRIMIGCGFLFALNSLSKAGFQQIDALEQMITLAKPYLKYRIQIIMDLMADGMDMGQSLVYSGLDFPDKQMVRELAIQTKYSDTDDSLETLSHTLADDGLEMIRSQAKALNTLISMLVFGVIGFLYISIYGLGQELANIKTN